MNLLKPKNIFFIIRCFLSITILIYLCTLLNGSNFYVVISRTNLTYVWIAPLLILMGFYFAAIRWHVLLSSFKVYQCIGQNFRIYLVGSFYSIVLPGVIGGDAVRISLSSLNKNRSFTEITLSVFIERILGFIVLLTLGSFAVPMIPQDFTYKWGFYIVQTLYTTTLLFLLVLLITYGLIQILPEIWLVEKENNNILKILIKILAIFKKISPIKLLVIAFWTSLFQASDIITSFILAKSVGISLPLSTFFVVIPIVYIVTLLPVSLGGLGVREGVLTYLLSQIGVLQADAVICSLLIYINRLLVSLIGGFIQLLGKI